MNNADLRHTLTHTLMNNIRLTIGWKIENIFVEIEMTESVRQLRLNNYLFWSVLVNTGLFTV